MKKEIRQGDIIELFTKAAKQHVTYYFVTPEGANRRVHFGFRIDDRRLDARYDVEESAVLKGCDPASLAESLKERMERFDPKARAYSLSRTEKEEEIMTENLKKARDAMKKLTEEYSKSIETLK